MPSSFVHLWFNPPSLCMLSQPDVPVIFKVVFNTTRLSEALSKCFFGHWEHFHPFLYHLQSIFVFKPFSLIIELFEYKNKPKWSDDSMFIHIRLLISSLSQNIMCCHLVLVCLSLWKMTMIAQSDRHIIVFLDEQGDSKRAVVQTYMLRYSTSQHGVRCVFNKSEEAGSCQNW